MPADELMSPWPKRAMETPPEPADLRGGDDYAQLQTAQRLLQDRLAGAALPAPLEREVTARLGELNDLLAAYQVPERDRIDGWRPDLPGRGHPLLPPFVVDSDEDGTLRGRVTFTRLHLGGGNAVHGGVPPLLFDDVLGRVANHGMPSPARTAYLRVDFRRVTPLHTELFWDGTLAYVDGRKRMTTARLRDAGGHLLAEAEALYVELLPGQP